MMTTDLSLRAGETRTLVVGPITDDDTGAGVGLAGVSLTFAIKRSIADPDAAAVAVLTEDDMTVTPGTEGEGDTVSVPLAAGDTRDLIGLYVWSLQGEDLNGVVKDFAGGAFAIMPTAWRGGE